MMQKKLQYPLRDFLFAVALILFFASVTLESTYWASRPSGTLNNFTLVLKMMRYVAYLLAVEKVLLDRCFSSKIFLILFLVFSLIGISMLESRDKTLFLYLFFLTAALKFSSEKMIKCAFATRTVIWLFTLFCALTGIIEDYVRVEEARIRHFLGFDYVTLGFAHFLYLFLQFLFLKKGKLRLREYAVLMTINFLLYYWTKTRFPFVLTICILTFFLFYSRWFSRGILLKKLKWVFVLSPFMMALISVWAAFSYNASNIWWSKLDLILSGRLYFSQQGLLTYGITLWGQPIKWQGSSLQTLWNGYETVYNYVDCSYLQILLNYGLVVLFLVLVFYALLIKKSIKEGEYYLTWIILFILLHSMTEPFLISMGYNPFILLFATELCKRPSPERNRFFQKDGIGANLVLEVEEKKVIHSA